MVNGNVDKVSVVVALRFCWKRSTESRQWPESFKVQSLIFHSRVANALRRPLERLSMDNGPEIENEKQNKHAKSILILFLLEVDIKIWKTRAPRCQANADPFKSFCRQKFAQQKTSEQHDKVN